MRIKHYIVTYNNNPILEKCVRTILATPAGPHARQIFIINNHTNFALPEELLSEVTVLHNVLRPDFSTGHLARNWNQALIAGFERLNRPAADIVICCQNDTEFAPNYLENTVELHKTFDLVSTGAGDNCISYTPRAVKRVGLWDERFCGITHQEGDYLLRAAKYLNDKASINDGYHGRVLNPVTTPVTMETKTGYQRRDPAHLASIRNFGQCAAMFTAKWGIQPERWSNPHAVEQKIDNYILYPYFEGEVETLREQRYLRP